MTRLLFLCPVSILLHIIIVIRNKLYDWNMLRQTVSKIPVISIGNIQVGGSGKTPFVVALIKLLLKNNIHPLIITRGYKRNTKKQIILNNIKNYSVEEVGDEPYYLKTLFNEVPIVIDHNKRRAINAANTMTNIDYIILDDGYQSRYIKRDIDIVLINTWQEKQNFHMMPLGYLREKISNLNRADFIYTTKGNKSKKLFSQYKTKNLQINYQIIAYDQKRFNYIDLIPTQTHQKIVAFSGIANPEHFFESLTKLNINYHQKIALENHYQYNSKKHPIIDDENIIYITTYKDFFKLNLKKSMVYILDMQINIKDELLFQTIKKKINET